MTSFFQLVFVTNFWPIYFIESPNQNSCVFSWNVIPCQPTYYAVLSFTDRSHARPSGVRPHDQHSRDCHTTARDAHPSPGEQQRWYFGFAHFTWKRH